MVLEALRVKVGALPIRKSASPSVMSGSNSITLVDV